MSNPIRPPASHLLRQPGQLDGINRGPIELEDSANSRHELHLSLSKHSALPTATQQDTHYQIATIPITSDLALDAFAPFRVAPKPPSPTEATPTTASASTSQLHTYGWLCGADRNVTLETDRSTEKLHIEGIGRFALHQPTASIRCLQLEPGVTQALLEEALLGPPLTLALARRNIWCLHASALHHQGKALLLLGDSGQGKSTLARHATLYSGIQRLADDILPCAISATGPVALPHFPQLKLSAPQQYPSSSPSQIPLKALIFLHVEAGIEPQLSPLNPAAAMKQLADQTVAIALFEPTLRRAQLTFAAQLLRHTPAYRLSYPHNLQQLPLLIKKIVS